MHTLPGKEATPKLKVKGRRNQILNFIFGSWSHKKQGNEVTRILEENNFPERK